MVHFSLAFQFVPCSWYLWFNVIIRKQSHSDKECITLLILFLSMTFLCNMPFLFALPAFLVTVLSSQLWCLFLLQTFSSLALLLQTFPQLSSYNSWPLNTTIQTIALELLVIFGLCSTLCI